MDDNGTLADLKDPKFVQIALLRALQDGDYEAVMHVYRTHLGMLNRTQAARMMKVSRQYVYEMLGPSNSPSLRTFVAFMRLLRDAGATDVRS
jgi:DNA-binding phage protein